VQVYYGAQPPHAHVPVPVPVPATALGPGTDGFDDELQSYINGPGWESSNGGLYGY
jgi:hypothetical protein